MGPCLQRFFIDMVWDAGIILHCAVSTSLPRASRTQASAQTGQKETLPWPPHSQASAQVKKQPYTGAQTSLTKQSHLGMPWETRGDKARQSNIISAQHPQETGGSKERQRETKQNHLSPASRHAMGDKGRQAMGDKARQGETKQSDPTPASRHATGDKGRQSKIISAQRPDTPWETRRNEAKRTHASIQTRHGRQGATKGDKSAQHPSIQTHHGRQGEAKGDFFSKQTTSPNYLRLYKTLPEVPHGCRNFLLIRRPA